MGESSEQKLPGADEQHLASSLFGRHHLGAESTEKSLVELEGGERGGWSDNSDDDDEKSDAGIEESSSDSSSTTTMKRKSSDLQRTAAWFDSDDETQDIDISATNRLRKLRRVESETVIAGTEYSRRLRAQFRKMNPATAWATIPEGAPVSLSRASAIADGDTDGLSVDIFQSSSSMLRRNSNPVLKREHLDVLRVKDANLEDRNDSIVNVVQFHPRRSLMMTAGLDKKIRLFDVDGKFNRKVQGIMFPDMPVRSAQFIGCVSGSVVGEEIVASGRRPFFYSVDLGSAKVTKIPRIAGRPEKSWERMVASPDGRWLAFLGNDGYIVLCSGRSKQWIANLKMNGNVRAAAFSPNSQEIVTVGSEGDVYRWNLADRKCVHRHRDEGNMAASALAIAPNGKYYAVGSTAGVVNVYDADSALRSKNPTPLKSVMNLTTPIDGLEWNYDSQILAIRSQRMKDQFKLVHCPSFTTYQNWPTANTPLGYSTSQAFSPHSGFLALGNDKGKVLLYRLKHYTRV
jgi:U3 small nucleolar RNA-associated protein 18